MTKYFAHGRSVAESREEGVQPVIASFQTVDGAKEYADFLNSKQLPPADVIRQRLLTSLIIFLLGFSLGTVLGLAIQLPH